MKALLLAALFAVPAAAAWKDLPPADFPLDAPPARGSAADDKDFSELFRLQAERTPDDCAQALAMKSPDFHSLFDNSGILTKTELAAVGAFLMDASEWLGVKITGFYKKKYGRARPYDEDPRLEPCADKPGGHTAYPSGHAAAGAFDACVLADLFPQRANVLASYGKRVGDLRAIGGVHHPTDIAAGQDLGARVCARLLKEPDFAAELARLKAGL